MLLHKKSIFQEGFKIHKLLRTGGNGVLLLRGKNGRGMGAIIAILALNKFSIPINNHREEYLMSYRTHHFFHYISSSYYFFV